MPIPPRGARVLLCFACLGTTVLSGGGLSVDTSDREAVRQFYRSVYYASEGGEMDWTGTYSIGLSDPAGSISPEWTEATRLRVNFFRAMAGTPGWVEFSPARNVAAQDAALMVSVKQSTLGSSESWNPHEPDLTWPFYTPDGADAASKGNIALGPVGAAAVTSYMRDSGNNPRVGHRRWLLHPPHREMGTGDVPGSEAHLPANVLWVLDGNTTAPYPALRDNFVAWPPPGYVPHTLVYPRWSFAAEGADFSDASVSVTRDGAPFPVTIEHRPGPAAPGAHLVWHPDGIQPEARFLDFLESAQERTFKVTISGVAGAAQSEYTYTTRVFDPYRPTEPRHLARVRGEDHLWSESHNSVSVRVPSFADGRRLRELSFRTATWIDDASSGDRYHFDVSEGEPIVPFPGARGGSVILLGHPDYARAGQSEVAGLKTMLMPDPGATLHLRHQLTYATRNQVALIEVSTDPDKNVWEAVWSMRGTAATAAESELMDTFEEIDVHLEGYEERTLYLRFRYLLDPVPGSQNVEYAPRIDTEGNPTVGWAIDEVRLFNIAEVEVVGTHDAGLGEYFHYKPEQGGVILLQAGATAFGGLPLEWGRVRSFTVWSGEGHPFVGHSPADSVNDGHWYSTPVGNVLAGMWTQEQPWVYSDVHGFIHVTGKDEAYLLYDVGIGSWLHVHPENPQWFFHYGQGVWLYLSMDTRAPERHFFLPHVPDVWAGSATDKWIHERDL
ncbi:MAG: hypothetical protein JJU00_00420 [Opitutales bacterium]|nr:hypothetical protein [Opitutales bacterium]